MCRAKILDGNKIAFLIEKQVRQSILQHVSNSTHLTHLISLSKNSWLDFFSSHSELLPRLGCVCVGDRFETRRYAMVKQKRAAACGIESKNIFLPSSSTMSCLRSELYKLNQNKNIHGILLQLPLPPHLDPHLASGFIDLNKDVDALHPIHAGDLWTGAKVPMFLPCTPLAVLKLLQSTRWGIAGRHVVILGRSTIVSCPLIKLLLQQNATVSITDYSVSHAREICRQGDILIVAIGQPRLVTDKWIKTGAVVIDVGFNRMLEQNASPWTRLVGDVDFEKVQKKASFLSPVPGGVGPVTVAMLLKNTWKAYCIAKSITL